MHARARLSVLVLLSALSVSAQELDRSVEGRIAIEKARIFLERGEPERAAAILSRLVADEDRSTARAEYLLAEAAAALGDSAAAQKHVRRALGHAEFRKSPDFDRAVRLAAESEIALGPMLEQVRELRGASEELARLFLTVTGEEKSDGPLILSARRLEAEAQAALDAWDLPAARIAFARAADLYRSGLLAAVTQRELWWSPNVAQLAGAVLAERQLIVSAVPDLDLVFVPAGAFVMGSPPNEVGRDAGETEHSVVLTRPFYLAAREVTEAQYAHLMGGEARNPSHPAVGCTWFDAVVYCDLLSRSAGLEPAFEVGDVVTGDGKVVSARVRFLGLDRPGFRLPTEAEWEYACRAGLAEPNDVSKQAWYVETSGDRRQAAGMLEPNALGLYDLRGNVHEWCLDTYAPYAEGEVRDPLAEGNPEERVVRGGSYSCAKSETRAAYRWRYGPGSNSTNLGFRIARTATGD